MVGIQNKLKCNIFKKPKTLKFLPPCSLMHDSSSGRLGCIITWLTIFQACLSRICSDFIKYKTISMAAFFTCADSSTLMCGSCHTRNVLIGIECRNCCQTLDVYLLFTIWMGLIQSKLIHTFVTYGLASL